MDQNKIGEFIKKLRKDNHLTQKDFAELFGVTYQAVSKWENGQNMPDISILKEICNKFNVDINEILEGKRKQKKKNIKSILIIVIIFIILIGIFCTYIFLHNHDFTFKNVRSNCDDFTVLGSMAYNDDKTSINISSISCLSDDAIMYTDITCILYEQVDDVKRQISKDTYKGEAIKLNDYLNTVEFNIDDYESTCSNYSDDSLSIELKAVNEEEKTISYEIPLILNNICNSTSS